MSTGLLLVKTTRRNVFYKAVTYTVQVLGQPGRQVFHEQTGTQYDLPAGRHTVEVSDGRTTISKGVTILVGKPRIVTIDPAMTNEIWRGILLGTSLVIALMQGFFWKGLLFGCSFFLFRPCCFYSAKTVKSSPSILPVDFMKPYCPILLLGTLLLAGTFATAQTSPVDTTAAPAELNFDEFTDADDRKVKTFATQKVLYLSPTRLISVGYEAQFGGQLSTSLPLYSSSTQPIGTALNAYRGLRLALNTPVISRSNLIVNLGLTYWNTAIQAANPERSPLYGPLNLGLRTTGLNVTVFKPLDARRFLIIQANADANGNYRGFGDLSGHHLTYSALAVYGWKKDDNQMWGLGVTRTYRGGNLLHLPVLFYNKTFNQRWGVEAVLPARAAVRRNFGTNSLLSLGYELEGNAYFLSNGHATHLHDWYVRRSEIKPRINYERKLSGFVWLAVQAGMSLNWRFDVQGTQNPTANEIPRFNNQLRNAPYVNISLNLVSP